MSAQQSMSAKMKTTDSMAARPPPAPQPPRPAPPCCGGVSAQHAGTRRPRGRFPAPGRAGPGLGTGGGGDAGAGAAPGGGPAAEAAREAGAGRRGPGGGAGPARQDGCARRREAAQRGSRRVPCSPFYRAERGLWCAQEGGPLWWLLCSQGQWARGSRPPGLQSAGSALFRSSGSWLCALSSQTQPGH